MAPFARLDPRVAGPTLLLLVAVDQAWDARDAAFGKLSPSEQRELVALEQEHRAHPREAPSSRLLELSGLVDEEGLINAAIMLDDTLEGVVMPALKQAVQSGAWPATATADPVGVLRLGSPGNDIERVDRIVQIDPSGDDVYYNNAGASTIGHDQAVTKPGVFPVAISVDMSGNDAYHARPWGAARALGISGSESPSIMRGMTLTYVEGAKARPVKASVFSTTTRGTIPTRRYNSRRAWVPRALQSSAMTRVMTCTGSVERPARMAISAA